MKIEIRKNGVPVAIITFHTRPEKFESNYDRVKFFNGLHGWNQVIPNKEKRYIYRRAGILDEVPHVKVADSAFIVAAAHIKRVMDYFDEWSDKVECEMMKAMMRDQDVIRQLREKPI